MQLRLTRWSSPLGALLLVTDSDGVLRALDYADFESRMHDLLKLHYGHYTLNEGPAPNSITDALAGYFEGELDSLEKAPTATGGTPFQREVWAALRQIPHGTTITYGQLATKLGRTGASRAVGAANGANPIAIVVPCHRVIGANGQLTGYAGGLSNKHWLLNHERQFAPALVGV